MQSNSMEWEVWSHLFSTQMRWGSGTAGPQSHPLHCSSPHRAELSQLYGSTERWGRVVQTPSREARLYLGSSFSWDVKLCIAGCAAFSSDLSSWCFTDLCSCCITQSACAAMHPKCLQIKAFFFFFPTNNPYGGELLFNSGSKLIWFGFKCWKIFGANLFHSSIDNF